jgi:hypothetical protein
MGRSQVEEKSRVGGAYCEGEKTAVATPNLAAATANSDGGVDN